MTTKPQGMLFVATDVAQQDEAEFNQWYDREHVEERARIEGFISAARYQAVGAGRKYLGLYRTTDLDAFTSPAYRAAFGRQTAWSVTNLDRMVDPMRRVCAVGATVGQGTGSRLSVLTLPAAPDTAALHETAAKTGAGLSSLPGFVQSYLLLPDAGLSSPLPKENPANRSLLPMWVVETSHAAADADAVAEAVGAFGTSADQVVAYALAWKLFSSEFAA